MNPDIKKDLGRWCHEPAKAIDARLVRMARAGLGLSIRELAELSGLNKATIVRIEAGTPIKDSTLESVRRALESAGADFQYCDAMGNISVCIRDHD